MSSPCGFSMTDLKNMVMIIETCQKRGAFHAEEMSGVGALYDKLKKADEAHSKLDKSVNTDKECDDGNVCEEGVCNKGMDSCDVGT